MLRRFYSELERELHRSEPPSEPHLLPLVLQAQPSHMFSSNSARSPALYAPSDTPGPADYTVPSANFRVRVPAKKFQLFGTSTPRFPELPRTEAATNNPGEARYLRPKYLGTQATGEHTRTCASNRVVREVNLTHFLAPRDASTLCVGNGGRLLEQFEVSDSHSRAHVTPARPARRNRPWWKAG